MNTIYFDNFRGFNSTFLSLKDVNFFIGENSTGKSSILKLIGILSSTAFWRYLEFGGEEMGLGSFKDIVNKGSKKDFFEIATIWSNDAGTPSIIKMLFIENENQQSPSLKEMRILNKGLDMQISIDGDGDILKYRYIFLNKDKLNFENSIDFFTGYINNDDITKIKFDKIAIHRGVVGIHSIVNRVTQDIRTKHDINYESFYEEPDFVENLVWLAPARATPQKTYKSKGSFF